MTNEQISHDTIGTTSTTLASATPVSTTPVSATSAPAAAVRPIPVGTVSENVTMTIGELSEVSGLSTSAIRFYQRRGVLPARVTDGWQRFDTRTLDRLAVIELAKSAGFTLDEVIRILDALDQDPDSVPDVKPVWQGLAQHKISDIDARITRLQQMRTLLSDASRLGYLPADRASQVPALLGWSTKPSTTSSPSDTSR